MTAGTILEVDHVQKAYAALRPLRMRALALRAGERVALTGIDAAATELLVNLITGASLPDTGEIRVEGRSTSEIANGEEWLASLDRFGIVSARAVLLEGATVAQNLAIPFTLEIEPIPADVRRRIDGLAGECGIAAEWMEQRVGELPPEIRVRTHLARGVALAPILLVIEHPTADVATADRPALAADIARVADARGLSTLIVTMDQPFALAAAHRTLAFNAATGDLKPVRRGWFG